MIRNSFLSLLLSVASIFGADTRLGAGDSVPAIVVQTVSGEEQKLSELVSQKPSVLIFYRGGWCPFCTRHLKDLAGIEKDLEKAGAQLLAISVDRPEKLKATAGKEKLPYILLSDSEAAAAKAFGIAFTVDPATVKKYRESYNIDLEDASGRTHHMLPHPAVYVADTNGKIRFAHVNEDYKQRLAPAEILNALQKK